MQNDDDMSAAAARLSGSASVAAAQTVSASVAELTRKVEQTEGQLRAQLRLNLLLVVINLATLVLVYLYAGSSAVVGGVDGGGGGGGGGGDSDFLADSQSFVGNPQPGDELEKEL